MQLSLFIFNAIFDLFLILLYYHTVIGKRKVKITLFALVCLGYEAALSLCVLLPASSAFIFVKVLISVCLAIILGMFYENTLITKLYSSIGFVCLCLLSNMLGDFFISASLQAVHKYSSISSKLLSLFCEKLFLCFFVFLIVILWKNRRVINLPGSNLLMLSIPLLDMLILLLIYIFPSLSEKDVIDLYSILIYISLAILCMATYFFTVKLLDETKKEARISQLETMLKLENEKYVQIIETHKSSRAFLHDVKKHFLYVDEWAIRNNAAELNTYIREQLDYIEGNGNSVQTGNLPIDAFVSDLIKKCELYSIKLNREISIIPTELTLEDSDLCVILGNLFDNAINSVKEIPLKDTPYISLKLLMNDEHLLINVVNATMDSSEKDFIPKDFMVSIANDHGFGLYNIQTTVEKYGGFTLFHQKDSCFNSEIVIPLPKKGA